jgi:protoporphyrinogen/coproporphyrinogen III oxidase
VRRLVVVGGGIAGIAAAWGARQTAPGIEGGVDIVLLERAEEVGGKARSLSDNGWLLEAGPGGFLGGRPEMDHLVEASGLRDALVVANPSAARRFLFSGGKLRRVIANPLGLARSGILSAPGLFRLLAEPFISTNRSEVEETVWDFAARRLGAEAADRLVAPMTLGIFAGDARRLSLPAAFPRMNALEREHGSLIRGLIARRGRMRAGPLTSFRDGMQSLPKSLAARGGFTVRCRADVHGLRSDGTVWHVMVRGVEPPLEASAVVLAGEPWSMAGLLRVHDSAVSADLDAITCPPVSVVGLGFAPNDAQRVPRGFGVLIPRGEGYRMLGNLWESYLYRERSPEGYLLIRAMYGGAVDPDAGQLPAPELLNLARTEIARLYGFVAPPVFERVAQWPRAIPQYELGHVDRVRRIERGLAAFPGLFITGNGLHGVAFADAAAHGLLAGQQAAQWLARSR